MGGLTRRVLTATLAIALFLATMAVARHDPLLSGGGGSGWVALEVELDPGETMSLGVRTLAGWTKFSMAVRVYDLAGEEISGGTVLAAEPGTGTRVEILGDGEGAFTRTSQPFHGSEGVGVRIHREGVYRLVGWVASDAGWAWELEGTGAVLASATGEAARVWTSEDFASLATARSGIPFCHVGNCGLGARADVAGEVAYAASGRLFGGFVLGVGGPNVLTASGPDGTVTCPCFFERESVLDVDDSTTRFAWGPGDYTFRVTGGGATGPLLSDVFLTVVDVATPW